MNNIFNFHILVTDDNDDLLDLIFLELKNHFQTVTKTNSVDQALEILKKEKIDLIVSDFQMPEKNGLDFIKILRETKDFTPFILLTGNASDKKALSTLNYMAYSIVDKPYISEILIYTAKQCLFYEKLKKSYGFPEKEMEQIDDKLNRLLISLEKKAS
ncbi:MAG: response regulator [Bacteriovoracaceae bacterium]|nr:response regulator [Bacteriovoracaceae bacterium]